MRLPSIRYVFTRILFVIKTYPLELLAAVTGTTAAWIMLRRMFNHNELMSHLLLVSLLALPLFLATTLTARYRNMKAGGIVLRIAVLGLMVFYFFTFHGSVRESDMQRWACFMVAAHLLVAAGPFMGNGNTELFWHYNKRLFLRILTSVIFSGVLYAGLAGAMAATNELFSLHIRSEYYGRLFALIAGLFNTTFFLAGIPTRMEEVEEDRNYPKVLKIFTQFVLIPLVTVYLIILLAYETKIVMQWSLPKGWVSNLILGYGIAGILSILLVYPIRQLEENKWVRIFSRWFYALLIPLAGLMFVAIGTRISSYGFTEERYFVLVLAVWLSVISLIFLFRPRSNIRIIPMSLAIVALLASMGPLSAFQVSRMSQHARLRTVLQRNHMLENGHAVPADHPVLFKERKAISNITEYLLSHFGNEGVQPIFNTDSLIADGNSYNNTDRLMKQIGLKQIGVWQNDDEGFYSGRFESYTLDGHPLRVSGYDLLLPFSDNPGRNDDTSEAVVRQNDDWDDKMNQSFALYRHGEKLSPDIFPAFTLSQLYKKYGHSSDVTTPQDVTLFFSSAICNLQLEYRQISGNKTSDSTWSGIGYNGWILIKWN